MSQIMKTVSPVLTALALVGCMLLTGCSSSSPSYPADVNLDSLLISAIRKTNALNFEGAHEQLNEVVEVARERNDQQNLILGNINLGVLYLKYHADAEALKYFLKSQDLAEEFKKEDLLNTIYNNIGIIYSSNNAHDTAVTYYEKALAISHKQKNTHRTAINLINLGTELHKKKKNDEALRYLSESIDILRGSPDTLNMGVAIANIGDIYYQRKQYDSSVANYRMALALEKNAGDKYYSHEYQLNLGKSYYQLHKYDSAEMLFLQSLTGFEKTKGTENKITAYEWLSQVNQAQGDIQQALDYARLSMTWKDTLLQEKTSKWISELQMRYEFGKKETEIVLLNEQAVRQKQVWSGIIIVGVIIGSLVVYTLRTKNINLKQRNVILQKEQELSLLTLEKNKAIQEQLEKDIIAKEKLNELEKERLKQEITFRDRELATKALHLVNKNETFASIHKLLSTIDFRENQHGKTQVEKVRKMVRGNEVLDQEWEAFKLHFEEVHPGFFSQLQLDYPTLSANDLRLSAYILIDLNAKEIAHIFNISPESVRKRKQRLRQKLNLEQEEDIKGLLNRFRQS